jgi:DNA-binding SARP family transcriptional activator
MGQLVVGVLGTPHARHGDVALTFPTRKALALFLYLTVEGGLHARDKLAAMLWPDTDHAHGRAMLRYTLTGIRKALAQDSTHAPHVLVERDSLGVDLASDIDLDLTLLQTAETLTELRAAAQRCGGEFLDGLSLPDAPEFDEWTNLRREWCHRYMERLFDRLSNFEIESGQVAEALSTAQRWRAISPLNEEAHRRAMRMHIAIGDRTAALRAYEACRRLLESELHVDPSPETQMLADRIRASADVAREVRAEPSSPRLFEGPLVGRDEAFAKLMELFARACRGELQAVVVQGEPGIGKSRLAREFVAWLMARGADLLQGRAFETGGRLPYQPPARRTRECSTRCRWPQRDPSDRPALPR